MNKKNLNYFKKRLVKELEGMSGGADCNFDGLNDPQDNLPDLIDRASSFIDRGLSENMCDRESLRIRRIEQALADISSGDYGKCKRCGGGITLKRLKATPEARLCIRCKAAMETRERLMQG